MTNGDKIRSMSDELLAILFRHTGGCPKNEHTKIVRF